MNRIHHLGGSVGGGVEASKGHGDTNTTITEARFMLDALCAASMRARTTHWAGVWVTTQEQECTAHAPSVNQIHSNL